MPHIITKAQLVQYLEQLDGHSDEDPVLEAIIERAESIVEEFLGVEFGAYTSATVVRVQSWGTQSLRLPPHDPASTFIVKNEGGTTVLTDWEYDAGTGMLRRTATYPSVGRWPIGRYEVTGNWGTGPVPASVQQVTLELAVNIHRAKDKGMWTEIIGVEGGGELRFVGGLTSQQRAILGSVKRRLNPAVLFA